MAISLLNEELQKECDGNIFAEGYNKYQLVFSHFQPG
jgi:hypothetical protein